MYGDNDGKIMATAIGLSFANVLLSLFPLTKIRRLARTLRRLDILIRKYGDKSGIAQPNTLKLQTVILTSLENIAFRIRFEQRGLAQRSTKEFYADLNELYLIINSLAFKEHSDGGEIFDKANKKLDEMAAELAMAS